ncbi:lysophospholipid acyltransferase family protein [Chloracidobacterium aggregatum]|uniref:Lysophospholipid acyltransferase family protein n=2 Tax=Chloracidobacterium TaxID=458032 RepID=A0ABX8B3H8_9BACT|nr:lysophospholipid acyltransferase family protein [Chloracidobacterium aggregatum]QUV85650.1 lysophospholipid acyltransferase family protein [Chloracidobacterium sp. 2]QUV87946.1 lysophospholipid acyltransferase family protein [Chloracidobacterium sp. S]QUV90866.1 lysophospholipid acyltransferase family protein [Chloracidobacterium sp. A]QUV94056.1 lysophospholipid acyltransferase family protein [Chloracidobacterium sp. N]QUV97252.1 lysophospholipid acyltransferase family protein [Chloracidob
MLPAQPSPLFQRVVHAYNQHLLRRAFHAVWWRGVDVFTAEPRRPLLIYANHPGWWDPLLAFFVVRRTGRDGYMMGEETTLRTFRFFRWMGGFSVNRADARDVARSIRYASERLAAPSTALWIFPQGEIVPPDKRPLTFLPGAAHILRRTTACIAVPTAIRYEFHDQPRPEVFLDFGPGELIRGAEVHDITALTCHLQARLTERMDALRDAVWERRPEGFSLALRGQPSISDRYAAVVARLTGKRAA